MPLFGKATKSPTEVVRILKDGLLTLERGGDGKKQEKALEDITKQFSYISTMIFGSENEQQSDVLLAQLSQACQIIYIVDWVDCLYDLYGVPDKSYYSFY